MSLFLILSSSLIIIDYLTKHLAYSYLPFHDPIPVITGIVRIFYLKNTGAAFGMLKGNQFFLIAVSSLVAIYIIYYVHHEYCCNRLQLIGLSFLFGGTVGNLINRIFSDGVIDFIDLYGHWPVFNFADIFINIGIFLIIISILRTHKN